MPENITPVWARFLWRILIALGSPLVFLLQIGVFVVLRLGRLLAALGTAAVVIVWETIRTGWWFVSCVRGFLSQVLLAIFLGLDKMIADGHQQFSKINRFLDKIKTRSRLSPSSLAPDQTLPAILPKKPLSRPVLGPREAVIFLVGVLSTVAVLYVRSSLAELPNPRVLAYRDIPVTTRIYDRNGILLYRVYARENRSLVRLEDIPTDMINAAIAFEDKNYYHHVGLDFRGIVRAAFANASGQPTQGGSTITQQLVKAALLSPERTWERKIKELLLSLWTERLYSKKQILEMYFNQVAYGGEIYGIETAAETYFGKKVNQLSLAESAALAGLPSAPSVYSPYGSHPEKTREIQGQVLDAMVAQKYISSFQAEAAKREELHFRSPSTEIRAPHFVMYVKDYLISKYGQKMVEQGGLDVQTTLDYKTYEFVARQISDGVAKQKNLNVSNGAALAVNPKTGEILVMDGSVNYFDLDRDGNVNVTLAQRSPGSSIKPLTYALALERKLITPATIIDDSPVTYRSAGTEAYSPQNYDNRFHGRVSVRTALASSLNIPAVKILDLLGVSKLIDQGRQFGITSWQDPSRYGLALTLGGGEVTLLELTQMFSVLANGGTRVNLSPVIRVTDYRGHTLEDNTTPERVRVVPPDVAFLVSDILADNQARSLTFGPNSLLVIPGKTVSVKTGTTQEKRDNLTIGYTPSLVVAVWVGNNDNSPMSAYLESGNTGAAAIWNPIMTELLKNQPNEPPTKPTGIIESRICTVTGQLICDNCPANRMEYFLSGTEPKSRCNFSNDELDRFRKDQDARSKATRDQNH